MKFKTNNSCHRITVILIIVVCSGIYTSCKKENASTSESRADIDSVGSPDSLKLKWFHEAKFGLFVHWGLYTIPASGEWVQFGKSISGKEYETYAAQFNPVKFNAKEWVSMAKDAGMKYIVITTKHHDGFCMFDSKLTNYDIVDATPFGKDPMKDLAKECKKQGLKLCFYYSVKDWHHPEYPLKYTYHNKINPEGFHGFPNANADYKKYFAYLQGQVKELLTNYGDVGIIWWDWYGSAFAPDEVENRKMAEALVDSIHKWQPGTLINNRLGGIGADYGTPEQMIPGGKQSNAFEVCMTLNGTWGYSKGDASYKSTATVISNLVDIASKGGNYLLNVGPTEEGIVPKQSRKILKEVGDWLARNGESIYGTTSGGPSVEWNEDIEAITAKPNTLYLHIFKWPTDNKIYLNDFVSEFDQAYLLTDKEKKKLKVDKHAQGLMIHLPERPVDDIDNVIVIKYKGKYVSFHNG